MKKSIAESAIETCEENVVVDQGKQCEDRQLSELSTVAGINATSDSATVGTALPRLSDVSMPDNNVVHSKFEGRRDIDEQTNKKSDLKYSRAKYGGKSKIIGEISEKASSSSLPTGLSSQNSGLVDIAPSKSTDNAIDLQSTNIHASDGKSMPHISNSRDIEDDKPSNTKGELLEGSKGLLNSLLTTESASEVGCGDPSAPDLKPLEKKDTVEVEIQPIDETDDCDMVEHDVKVCDTCGDAGQEELLAICSRCIDGAEHTYCMREMLDKVPEGDWLCEECKSLEQVRNERPEKILRVLENEKSNSSGQASTENVNSSDIEGRKTKGYIRFPGKRPRDDADAEVSSVVKKPSCESIVGTPKISNSRKTAALSCEISSKKLDIGRKQSSCHSSPDTVPVNDASESANATLNLQGHNSRGTFSKSDSFNSLSSKPKVKLVDQAVLQRKISAREHASFRHKEGISRSIGKSMSFKPMSSRRFETKANTLSPRVTYNQDLKSTKQQSTFEHQSSFKMEYPSVNSLMGTSGSSTPRIDKKPRSGGESFSLSAIANHVESKPVQTDAKSTELLRSASLVTRKNGDLSSSSGEVKRLSMHGHSAIGVLTTNGANNKEQKSVQTNPKDSSCSVVAERPPSNEGLPDGLSQSRDFGHSGDRVKEYSGSHSPPSSVKPSRDEGDILKAAIEAAVLRKPGLYHKHRALGQSNNSSMSSVGHDTATCQDHVSGSAEKRTLSSVAELPERPGKSQHLKGDFVKQETLTSSVPVEGLSSGGGDAVPIVPSNGRSSIRDTSINIPAALPFWWKSLAIPEHEYIWQGSFEICRGGKVLDSWGGIQAHLSMCASPKVIEAVNKFKSKIVLYEVPRLSTWPTQFQEHGVREDNIALFFFAKDLESYYNIYKLFLDNMMKNDLALKGNCNGVELLIFPSNQLPDRLQRWNMLFFLCGVFKGKKESCSENMPESVEQCKAPRDMPPMVVSLPENRCSPRPIGNDLAVSEHAVPSEACDAEELCSLLSSRTVNGGYSTKFPSLNQLDSELNSSSSSAIQSDSMKKCQEMSTTCLEGGIISSYKPPFQAASATKSSGREEMLMQLDTPLDRQQSTDHLNNSAAANHDMEGKDDGIIVDRTCDQDLVKSQVDAEDLLTNGETTLEEDRDTKYPKMEQNRWLLDAKECLNPELCVVPQTLHAGPSPVFPGNDDDQGVEPIGALAKMNHANTGSCVLENLQRGACDLTSNPECQENAEKHFFPMETRPPTGVHLADRSMSWGGTHPLEQNQLHERTPNLELALGAEIKSLTQGNRPLLVGKADNKRNEEHIFREAGTNGEDDVSASLSLSLSFSFQ
ncbi:hypothetical protein CDL12_03777 [Handroanthus impetiginosus]|uniref:AIPP2-like SPOC-like domain-containing protein n=1 Tax=Handroanthus impetiginosus TaxID=429701 RepID=A0A2G9I198_9LAMI|nr:hypothetical protein CDL12_03777 [Handroanthus impetiginosus]